MTQDPKLVALILAQKALIARDAAEGGDQGTDEAYDAARDVAWALEATALTAIQAALRNHGQGERPLKTEVMRDDFGKVMGHVLVEPLSLRDEAQPSAPTADTGAGKLSADELDEIYASARDRFLHDNDGAQLSNHVAHLTGLRAVEARAAQDTGSGEGWQDIASAAKSKKLLLWGDYWSDGQGPMHEPMVGRWSDTNQRWEVQGSVAPYGVRPKVWCRLPTIEEAQAALLSAVRPK